MAGPHALSGVCAGLGVALVVDAEPFTAAVAALAGAGAALLPDVDHPRATATRALGPLSQAAHGVARLGGHRGPTHSLLAVAAAGGATWAAGLAGSWGSAVVVAALAVLVAAVLDRRIPGPHWIAAVACLPLGIGVATAGGLGLVDLDVLPWTVGAGVLAHLLGDAATRETVPWTWPWRGMRAGGTVERAVVTPVLTVGALGLGWLVLV